MKATIVEIDGNMLVLRPENDPLNVVLLYREDDSAFEQRKVGDVVELRTEWTGRVYVHEIVIDSMLNFVLAFSRALW
jgi:hypothetical protein